MRAASHRNIIRNITGRQQQISRSVDMHQIRRHFLVAPTKYSIQPPIHKVRVHLADHLTEEPVFGAQAVHQRRYFLSRSEEHTSELQSLMSISYAVFCLKQKKKPKIKESKKYTNTKTRIIDNNIIKRIK